MPGIGTDQRPRAENWFQRRNWWKIGFFAMLVAFEFTREVAVLSINSPTTIIGNAWVSETERYVFARGKWTWLDKEEDLVPASISIECDKALRECMEASVMILDNAVGTPNVSRFPASFDQNSVIYENSTAACVTYSTRIDLKLKRVFAVRQQKQDAEGELCEGTEDRIEMTLGDGWRNKKDPLEGHFLPIMSLLAAFAKVAS